MTNNQAIALIDQGVENGKPQSWIDLGCGTGVFTTALATILPAHSRILGVDRTAQHLPPTMGKQVSIEFLQTDFELTLPKLPVVDGILLANSLHFVKDKMTLVRSLETLFETTKRFLIVEYDTLTPNTWVPYPIDLESLKNMFGDLGGYSISKLGQRRSLYGSAMLYGALAVNEG